MKLKFWPAGLVLAWSLALATPLHAALTKVSTIVASSSASIQFTGLTSTYNTYYINCTGLLGSVAGAYEVFVGEGAGPTWETSAFYTNEFIYTGDGNTGANAINSTTTAGINGPGLSTTLPNTLRLWIDNVTSTTTFKNIKFETVSNQVAGAYFRTGMIYWNADNGAITGIEIIPNSGNIASGTCTLYGLTK